jgi:hypothetical protein
MVELELLIIDVEYRLSDLLPHNLIFL